MNAQDYSLFPSILPNAEMAEVLSAVGQGGPYMRDYIIPMVTEVTAKGERSFDIFSRLMRERIIILGTPVTQDVANIIVGQLLVLDAENPEKDIMFYINSPGGSVLDGIAILDTMDHIRSDIATICLGQAASMAADILAAGTKGKRAALPNSRIMIHQIAGGAEGQATDIEIQAAEYRRIKKLLNDLLVKHTGQPYEKIEADSERDFYMSAVEAKDYGLVDKVVTRVEDVTKD